MIHDPSASIDPVPERDGGPNDPADARPKNIKEWVMSAYDRALHSQNPARIPPPKSVTEFSPKDWESMIDAIADVSDGVGSELDRLLRVMNIPRVEYLDRVRAVDKRRRDLTAALRAAAGLSQGDKRKNGQTA